ncbi:MAG: sigma-54-dependent transcriptional regulator [Bradymonadia bacterium]
MSAPPLQSTPYRRILVADDEENIRHMLDLHLSREGFTVLGAADGEAALKALDEGAFDVILCDLIMPSMDGMTLLSTLGRRGVSTPVILMSAHADTDTALKAIQAGAFDYVAKPFRTEEVIFRVRKAIEQQQLTREVSRLREALAGQHGFEGIIARAAPMQKVFRTLHKVADYKTTVLLLGESGTGKELVARALHSHSPRREAPFIAINCGAIPESLLESELFGHIKGAFTDATHSRRGLFEEAHGGTLFLDEIGEMPLNLQPKLLRALQEQEIRPLGATEHRPVDVRVIAATVRDLEREVSEGRFREDLFYRLNVLPVRLPPLRDRRTDIPLLVEHFLTVFNARFGTEINGLAPEAMRLLTEHSWPGNIRELENTVERAVVLTEGPLISPDDLPEVIREGRSRIKMSLASGELSIKKTARIIEEELIRKALERTGGNRTRAAELLEISHRALLYKIKDYGLS